MPTANPTPVAITYVGGPTVTLLIAGVTFITDPTFDAAGKEYHRGPVTLKKLSDPAMQAQALGKVDVALVSHDEHPDNLDDAGRTFLADIPRVMTTTGGAQRLGNGALGLEPWQSITIPTATGVTLRVTATPARHGPVGVEPITGIVIGFVISVIETGEDLVYVTGDTVWYEGTAEVAHRFHPRAACAGRRR